LKITKENKETDIVTDLDSIKDPKMNEEDGVILKPLETTTEMNPEHLKSKVEVDRVENILKITKGNKEMDIVTDLDSIKNPKMNEEDGVILKPLEATTEINSDHQNPKDENCTVSRQGETGMEKYVKHILKVNKESNNPLKQLNIIPAMNIKENVDLYEIFPEKNIEQNPKSQEKNESSSNNISIIKNNEQSQKHGNPLIPLHVLHCQVTEKENNISLKPVKNMSAIQEIATPNCDQTNSSKKRKKYVVRKRKGDGVPVVDPTLVPRKFVRFNEISNRSAAHAKVCPVLKDSYKHLAVAKQDLKCAELVMEETKIEINKCEEQLQLAKEKFKLAKSRCETEENIVHRAAAYVAETELQVPCPWNQNFARLQKYNEEFGHIDLPSRCSEDKDLDTLCTWLARQKQQYQKYCEGTVTTKKPYRVNALEELGINWTIREDKWDINYQKLVDFKAKYGTTIVPTKNFFDKNFANWVTVQRHGYKLMNEGKKHHLSTERIDLLNKINFVWNVFDKKWREMYDELVAFQKQNGHINIPEKHKTNIPLARWVGRQRMEYEMYMNGKGDDKKCRMTKRKIDDLINIEFCFEMEPKHKNSSPKKDIGTVTV